MAEIRIRREHALGFAVARKLAFRWAEEAEERLGMECVYEEGRTSDLVTFQRTGVHGELKVTRNYFELEARLGMLLGAYKHKIEREIVRNLDQLLAHEEPHSALDRALDGHDRKHAPAKKTTARKKA